MGKARKKGIKVFVDTNILLDVLAKREPFYSSAAKIWTLVETSKLSAEVSAISFNNIYYIIRKFAGRKKAVKAIRLVHDVFPVTSVDASIISLALESKIADFEDAIQYYSARKAGANYIITRNAADFPGGGPMPLSSNQFLALLKSTGHY